MRGLGSGGMTRRWALAGLRLQGRGHSGGHCPPLSCFEASDTSSQGCQLLLAFVCPQSRTRGSALPRLGPGGGTRASSGWRRERPAAHRVAPRAARLPSGVRGARVRNPPPRRQGRSCPDLTYPRALSTRLPPHRHPPAPRSLLCTQDVLTSALDLRASANTERILL